MSKYFNNVPRPRIQRSGFDLSHYRKLSCRLGQLVPVLVQEALPGDKWNISTESMVRLAPLVAPVMHRMNTTIHFYFVPMRLLDKDFEEMITGAPGLLAPTQKLKVVTPGSLSDHLGLPLGEWETAEAIDINLYAHRAYFKIWSDYYRDQNLQAEIDVTDATFNNGILTEPLKYRAWEKDYFTSAFTSPQMGTEVKVPIEPVYRDSGTRLFQINGYPPQPFKGLVTGITEPGGVSYTRMKTDGDDFYVVDNIESLDVSVEELRKATRLQRWLERSMRSGHRYFEALMAHWNVKPQDARLQRAEYLGGGKTPVLISDVPNMTGTEDAPQGNLSGLGISVGNSNRASYYAPEHGIIMGILSVVPDSAYCQGVPKMFDRKLNLDWAFPEFAQLGEQEVKNQELFLTKNPIVNEGTFGYQSRYAEYKYAQSTVHGQFKNSLDFWHMARKFASSPSLNSEFITCDKLEDGDDAWRIFAVDTEDNEHLWIQLFHKITAVRPLPFLNDPTL